MLLTESFYESKKIMNFACSQYKAIYSHNENQSTILEITNYIKNKSLQVKKSEILFIYFKILIQ